MTSYKRVDLCLYYCADIFDDDILIGFEQKLPEAEDFYAVVAPVLTGSHPWKPNVNWKGYESGHWSVS